MSDDFDISTKVYPEYDINDQVRDFVEAFLQVAQDIRHMYFDKQFYLSCKVYCEELGIRKDILKDSYNYLPCGENYDAIDEVWNHLYHLACEHQNITNLLILLSNKYNVIFELRVNNTVIFSGYSSEMTMKSIYGGGLAKDVEKERTC